MKNLWIEIKCWFYWIKNVIMLQFESIGWWLERLELERFQEKCRGEKEKKKN